MAKKIKMRIYTNGKVETPYYETEGSVGLDLRATGSAIINPGETRMLGTGVHVEIPEGYGGFVYARSGLASKYGLAPANKVGVIDSGYRGEIKVALHNHERVPSTVAKGDRIAQFVIQPVLKPELEFVTSLEELTGTERNKKGFGSTGK